MGSSFDAFELRPNDPTIPFAASGGARPSFEVPPLHQTGGKFTSSSSIGGRSNKPGLPLQPLEELAQDDIGGKRKMARRK